MMQKEDLVAEKQTSHLDNSKIPNRRELETTQVDELTNDVAELKLTRKATENS